MRSAVACCCCCVTGGRFLLSLLRWDCDVLGGSLAAIRSTVDPVGAVIRAVGTVPLLLGVMFELSASRVVSRILVLRWCKPSIVVVVSVFLHLTNMVFTL